MNIINVLRIKAEAKAKVGAEAEENFSQLSNSNIFFYPFL